MTQPAPSGSCRISLWELITYPASMIDLNPILALAMKHGCPADGVIYPKPLPGIRYTRINRYDTDEIELRWEPDKTP